MKSYENGTFIQSVSQVHSLYIANHPLFKQWTTGRVNQTFIHRAILDRTANQKSMWIDSFGYGLSPDVISIEQDHYSIALENLPNVYFRKELDNIETCRELSQTFNPEIVVYYKSEFFKYLTLPELVGKITELAQIYSKLVIYMELKFIDFNKLKYPTKHVLSSLQDSLPICKIEHYGLNEILINI
jgi:hypothetical protein